MGSYDSARSCDSARSYDAALYRDQANSPQLGGCLRSPPEDHPYYLDDNVGADSGFVVLKLPDEFDLRDNDTLPRKQGARPTCAAFTAATIKELQEFKDSGFDDLMSPEFVYYHRVNKPAQGMYAADVFRILRRLGTVPEHLYPYGSTEEPSAELYKLAQNYTIKQYARIRSIPRVKQALIQFGPCYLALPLYRSRPIFWKGRRGEHCEGGHAVAIVGYNYEGFIIKNSWGDMWGDGGYMIFPYEDWPIIWECWLSVDEPSSAVLTPEANILLAAQDQIVPTGTLTRSVSIDDTPTPSDLTEIDLTERETPARRPSIFARLKRWIQGGLRPPILHRSAAPNDVGPPTRNDYLK